MPQDFNSRWADEQRHHALIPPPKDVSNKDTRSSYLVVDSRDRNTDISPSSSHYVVEYDDPFVDVVSAELVYARLALSRNNVDASTCEFSVIVETTTLLGPIVLPTGYFNPAEICGRVNAAIASSSSSISISFDATSQKFVFASSVGPFGLDFSSRNSCKALFGFHSTVKVIESVPVGSEWIVESAYPFVANDRVNDYAIMIIDNFWNMKSSNNATNGAFAIIDGEISEHSGEGRSVAKKYFNPPLNDLGRLKVRFVDRQGKPYSFAKEDHYFVLKIECLKNGRKYGWGAAP